MTHFSPSSSSSSSPPSSAQRGDGRSTLWWIAGALAVGFFALPRIFHVAESPLVGKAATDFSMVQVANAYQPDARTTGSAAGATSGAAEGSNLKLADLKGKLVLLDFWATWCGPCKAETPIVNALAGRYADRGLVVVGVNTSEPDGNAGPWARSHGLRYPIVYDEGDVTAAAYGVNSLPTLVLLSRDGKVIASRTGLTGNGELEKLIESAL